MINQLAELVKIYQLTPKGIRGLFLNPKMKGEKVNHLLKLIIDNPSISDDVAKQVIYGDKANSNTGNYNMLKVHLREKLAKYIFLISPKRAITSKYRVAYFNAYQQLFLSKALLSLGLTRSGVITAKSVIKKAIEIELWDVIASMASTLSDSYGSQGYQKKSEYYDDLARTGMRRFHIERKARRLVNRWNHNNLKNGRPDAESLAKLKNDVEHITNWNLEEPTTICTHLMYRLTITYQLICANYGDAINLINDAISYLKSKPYFMEHIKGVYAALKMFCYINLKDFDSAKNFAQQGQRNFPIGSFNWFTVMEFYYVLSIQTENYSTAHELIEDVISNAAYSHLPETRKQRWMILQAYMELLICTDIWRGRPKKIEKDRFKIDRFINRTDSLNKDKTGAEVSILVVYILFKIMYGQFEDVIDKRDALSRFIRRYLNQKEHERSRMFLTLLKKTIDLGFSYQRVKKRTEKLYASLKSKQVNYSYDYGGSEIVDYEILWEWLLTRLKNDRSKD